MIKGPCAIELFYHPNLRNIGYGVAKLYELFKEHKMKKTIKLSLCLLLLFGMMMPNTLTAQEGSNPEKVQEKQKTGIKELTIRNSGFRSRATIVIRYRDEDKKIVEVIENGKKLPPSEFSHYEPVMRKILELPQIDRLLPEIDRTRRRAESPRISEESKIREMMALRRRLEGLDSDIARRYRDINELQLMNQLNNLSEKISESSELSQEEKIQQLKDILEKMQAMELAKMEENRKRRLAEIGTANAARRLIAEINKSEEMSQEEKIKEIQKLLRQTREPELLREEGRRRNLIEFEAANTIRKMLQEISEDEKLSDQERRKEFQRVLEEAQKMKLESMWRMIGIEKFKFELNQLLKKEGLLPKHKAEFILRSNECLIDGKKLPEEIHQKILQLSEECLGNKFDRNTKIVLQLNEDR
jgi:hypothetical protein